MPAEENGSLILEGLNGQQRQAVQHGDRPLLIVAGAGTGKTKTLVHRVAQQIQQGIPPARILLLTFTRRAAAEMLRRVDGLLRQLQGSGHPRGGGSHIQTIWGGTFHATAARLLRLYAPAAGLEPAFTILDRSDSEDLLDVVRTELGLSKTDQRFPRKGTCLAIYSHCVNSQRPLEQVLTAQFPWCRDCAADLKRLFASYGERKEQGGILDYDDLLLFWRGLLADPQSGHADPQPLRLRAGGRVPGHQPGPSGHPQAAAARRPGPDGRRRRCASRSTRSARRPSATSSISRRNSPVRRSSSWSRTTAARSPS